MNNLEYTDLQIIDMLNGTVKDKTAAFKFLLRIENMQKRLWRVVNRLGCTTEDYEEIRHDALLALEIGVRKGTVTADSNIWGYMSAVARNNWVKRLDKKIRKRERDKVVGEGALEASEMADVELMHQERREQLNELFKQLSSTCQEMLAYRYLEDLTIDEILEKSDYATKRVVSSKLSKCMKALKDLLDENPHLKEGL